MVDKLKSFFLENQDTNQTIIKNAVWLTVSNVISRIIRAFLVLYSARILGAEGYGIFSYAMTVAAFFSLFSDLGMTSYLTKEASKKNHENNASIPTAIFLKLFFLLATVLIIIFFAPLAVSAEAVKPLIPLTAFLVVFDNLRAAGLFLARAKSRMEIEGSINMFTDAAIAIIGLVILFVYPSPLLLTASYLLGSALGAVLEFFVIRKDLFRIKFTFDRRLIKEVLANSIPFSVMGMLGSLMISIDTFIVGWLLPVRDLGIYSAAQRPVQILYLLSTFIATSTFPLINKFLEENNKSEIIRLLEKSISAILLFTLPIAAGGILISEKIINLVFGQEYLDASLSFSFLLPTILFVAIGNITSNALFALNKKGIFVVSTLVGIILNILLDLSLIPIMGIAGSALATMITLLLINAGNFIYLNKLMRVGLFSLIKKSGLAVIIMCFFIIPLKAWSVPAVPIILISAITYSVSLLLLREPIVFKLINKIRPSAPQI